MKAGLIAIYGILQFSILTLPLWFDPVESTEIAGAQAVLSIIFCWAAFLVKDLTLGQIMRASLFSLAAGSLLAAAVQFGVLAELPPKGKILLEVRPVLWRALATGMVFQLIAAGLLAAGFWMKRNRAPYIYRRAGTNRQERDHLFELRERMIPDGTTNFKYVSLQSVCPGVVLEYRGDIIAFFRFVNFDGALTLFEFVILPEARIPPHSRHLLGMFEYFRSLPGVPPVLFAARPAETDDLVDALLAAAGFKETRAPGIERRLAEFRVAGFEEWQPFAGRQKIFEAAS